MNCGSLTFRILLVAAAAAVVGCGGGARGSLAATASPDPSRTPASIPSPAGASSPTHAASPTVRADPSPSPMAAGSGLPAGWSHELTCSNGDGTGCQLHLYDATGRVQSGWPVRLAGRCSAEDLAVGNDGAVYVACVTGDELIAISSFGITGSNQPGWPVEVEGHGGPGRVLFVGPGDTVLVSTTGIYRDSSVQAFGVDGRPRSGWPRGLPREAQSYLGPDGTVIGWWYEDLREDTLDLQAARTKFTMIGPDGETLPGRWPITSTGTATAPIVTKDGSIFFTSETGEVWGHDPSGNVIDGWPYRLTYREPPELRPDGRLMVILGRYEFLDGTTSDSEVIVLTTAGQNAAGWPYRTSASLDGVQCDTDSYPYFPHAMAANGTVYLAPWTEDRAEVVAIDGRGQVVDGWPYRLPAGSRVTELRAGPAGNLAVILQDCTAEDGCCGSLTTRQITLTPTGDVAP